MSVRSLRSHVGHLLRYRRGERSAPVAIFRALYGRLPDEGETTTLDEVGRLGLTSPASLARHVIARFDRQVRPTPFTVRFSAEDVEFLAIHGFEMAFDRADPSVSGPLLTSRRYEPHLTRFFERHVRPGMTVVDVGANVGYYTMLAAGLVGETGRVLAFEPNSENCRLILLSLHRNGLGNVALHPLGLSDKAGSAYFSTHLGSNGGFLPSAEATLMDPNCVVVPTMKLDDLTVSTRVDLMKLDTEGAEGLILAGAQGLLERDRPIVTSEFSVEMLGRVSGVTGRAYLEIFRSLGYRTFLIDRGSREPRPIEDFDGFLNGFDRVGIEDLAFLPTSGPNAIA